MPCRAVPLVGLEPPPRSGAGAKVQTRGAGTVASLVARALRWEPSVPSPSRSLVKGNACPARVLLPRLRVLPAASRSRELCCQRAGPPPPAPAAPAQPGGAASAAGAALTCTGREDQPARLGFWGLLPLSRGAPCLQGLRLTSDGKDARFRARRRNVWGTDSEQPAPLGAGGGSAPRAGLSPLGPPAKRSSCCGFSLRSAASRELWVLPGAAPWST